MAAPLLFRKPGAGNPPAIESGKKDEIVLLVPGGAGYGGGKLLPRRNCWLTRLESRSFPKMVRPASATLAAALVASAWVPR